LGGGCILHRGCRLKAHGCQEDANSISGKEFGMKKKSLHHRHLTLVASMLAFTTLAIAHEPALAQQTSARWRPGIESVIVKAGRMKDWHMALTGSHLGKAFMVSASIPVPYSDLDLARDPDATEMGRRIQVAARLVCEQLDIKYPPTQYPILEGYSGNDCSRMAARDGLEQIDTIIASARH
jgi:UrcA family protein